MWDAFKDAIFICIEFFYNFVHDWGLAIVIVTLIFRLILFPLMQKQIKSTFQMQKFSPLMQETGVNLRKCRNFMLNQALIRLLAVCR